MSLAKFMVLIDLIGLVSLRMRGDRIFVGMDRVDRMSSWSDIGEKV